MVSKVPYLGSTTHVCISRLVHVYILGVVHKEKGTQGTLYTSGNTKEQLKC